MHIFFKRQIFGGGQGHTRRGNSLNGRVAGQIDKQNRPLNGPCLRQVIDEKLRRLERNTHCRKHHRKTFAFAEHGGLPSQLRRNFIMRQTRT